MEDRDLLKEKLLDATGCGVQHDGWCCNTCFFHLDLNTDKDVEELWQSVLAIRGDYINGEYFYIEPETIHSNVKHLIEIL